MSPRIALLFAILSPVFSGVATAFQGHAIRNLGALYVAGIASCAASMLIGGWLLAHRAFPPLHTLRAHARSLIVLVLLRNVFAAVLICYAFRYTSSVHVMFFTKVEAYLVLLWFWLLEGGVVSARQLVLLTVHLAGAILLSTGLSLDFGEQQWGDLLIVIAMGLTSLAYPLAAKLSGQVGAAATNAIGMAVGGCLLLPLAIIIEPVPAWSGTAVGALITYVVLFNVFSITFWFLALRSVKTWIVSALRTVSPLAGAPVAYGLFGETLSSSQWFGGALVLVTSTVMAREHLREKLHPIADD